MSPNLPWYPLSKKLLNCSILGGLQFLGIPFSLGISLFRCWGLPSPSPILPSTPLPNVASGWQCDLPGYGFSCWFCTGWLGFFFPQWNGLSYSAIYWIVWSHIIPYNHDYHESTGVSKIVQVSFPSLRSLQVRPNSDPWSSDCQGTPTTPSASTEEMRACCELGYPPSLDKPSLVCFIHL